MKLTFREALSFFAAEAGLPKLPDPLPSGLFELSLDNGLVIRILEQEGLDCAELSCEVGNYPEFSAPIILSLISRANKAFAATGGATLGADTSPCTVMLSLRVPLIANDESRLSRSISRFSEMAAGWKKIIEENSHPSAASESVVAGVPPSTHDPLRFA
jgi:hypothetical protein